MSRQAGVARIPDTYRLLPPAPASRYRGGDIGAPAGGLRFSSPCGSVGLGGDGRSRAVAGPTFANASLTAAATSRPRRTSQHRGGTSRPKSLRPSSMA